MGRVKQGGSGSIFTPGHVLRKTKWYRKRYVQHIGGSFAGVNYRASEDWERSKREVKARDGHACRACGKLERPPVPATATSPAVPAEWLHVHHERYWHPFRPDVPEHLVTLCVECHNLCHLGTPKTAWGLARQTRRVVGSRPNANDPDAELTEHWGSRMGPDPATLIGAAAGILVVVLLVFIGPAKALPFDLPCPPVGGPTCSGNNSPASAEAAPPEPTSPEPSTTVPPSSSSRSSAELPSSRPSSSTAPSSSSATSSGGRSPSLPASSPASPSSASSSAASSWDVYAPETWSEAEAAAWAWCMSGGTDMSRTDHAYRSERECRRDLRALHAKSTKGL